MGGKSLKRSWSAKDVEKELAKVEGLVKKRSLEAVFKGAEKLKTE